MPITGTRMSTLLDAVAHAYRVLGFEQATGGDEVFEQLVVARLEPTSMADSARVLAEAGIEPAPYRAVKRRLPRYAKT